MAKGKIMVWKIWKKFSGFNVEKVEVDDESGLEKFLKWKWKWKCGYGGSLIKFSDNGHVIREDDVSFLAIVVLL